jgi:chromosome segregation ATPase
MSERFALRTARSTSDVYCENLEREYHNIKDAYEKSLLYIQQLEDSNKRLEKDNEILVQKRTITKEQYDELSDDYNALKTKYELVNEEFDEFRKNFEELVSGLVTSLKNQLSRFQKNSEPKRSYQEQYIGN